MTPVHRQFEQLQQQVIDLGAQALIFDCDGTLADSMPVHFIAWCETLHPLGIAFDEARFYEMAGIPTDRILRMLAAEQGLAFDADDLSRIKEEKFLKHLPQLKPIEPVALLARQSHGNRPIAVASGGFREVVHQQLVRLELRPIFEVIVTAEDTERHKPEPDVFLEAARQLAVAPAICCVLEDSDLGIEAARRAGMSWIDVRPFHPPR